MIGDDYKPTTFLHFLWDKGRQDIIRTLFALILLIFVINQTPSIIENGSKLDFYLIIITNLVVLAATVGSLYLPYTIYKKLKNKDK